MDKLVKSFKQFLNDEEGMAAVEYALVVAIMALGISIAWNQLSTALQTAFTTVIGLLNP